MDIQYKVFFHVLQDLNNLLNSTILSLSSTNRKYTFKVEFRSFTLKVVQTIKLYTLNVKKI